MKFVTKRNNPHLPTYQVEFHNAKKASDAGSWLKLLGLDDWTARGGLISTDDIQVAFKLRLHFESDIKLILHSVSA